MIADNGYKFAYFYDTQGNYSLDFDYEEDFQKIRKEVRDKCVPDTNCGVNFTRVSWDLIELKDISYIIPRKIRLRKIFTLKN